MQELGLDKAYISETVFTFVFLSFVLVSILLIHFFAPNIWYNQATNLEILHAVDFPSFHIQEQENLHCPDMVQSLGIFMRM